MFQWLLKKELAAIESRLTVRADDAIASIHATFHQMVDAKVKAEMAKWAFSGGAGGALAAIQYCYRCNEKVARWSMIPDEGPVCAKCLDIPL